MNGRILREEGTQPNWVTGQRGGKYKKEKRMSN